MYKALSCSVHSCSLTIRPLSHLFSRLWPFFVISEGLQSLPFNMSLTTIFLNLACKVLSLRLLNPPLSHPILPLTLSLSLQLIFSISQVQLNTEQPPHLSALEAVSDIAQASYPGCISNGRLGMVGKKAQ